MWALRLETCDVSISTPLVDAGGVDVVSSIVVVCVRSVVLGVFETLESVIIPVDTGVAKDSTIILCPIDAVCVMDIEYVIPTPTPPVGANPVVVVTTSTLHSSCIAFPISNSLTLLVASISVSLHTVLTSAFTSTSRAKHFVEHTRYEFVKSYGVLQESAFGKRQHTRLIG